MFDIIGHILAPVPILLVGIGAGLIAVAQSGFRAATGAAASLIPLLRARPDDERDSARALLYRVEAVAELRGLARTDRVQTSHPFIAQALTTLANSSDVEHFSQWINQSLDDRRARHAHGRACIGKCIPEGDDARMAGAAIIERLIDP